MACYISSNNNRFYVALEQNYGNVAAVTGVNRIPAVQLSIKEQRESPRRRDKTGTRTFIGTPTAARSRVEYSLATYMSTWQNKGTEPSYGPLFQACLGGTPRLASGLLVESSTPDGRLTFTTPHGLSAGQAVAFGSDIRFVMAIVNDQTVQVNAPFTMVPNTGTSLSTTVTYSPGAELPSLGVFDYWSPSETVQRVVAGCGVNRLEIEVNGDYHEFRFEGPAREVVDTASFESGQGQLTEYPEEPTPSDFDYSLVPGHLGQAWLGSIPEQFFTLTSAKVTIENGLDTRNDEFGRDKPACLTPGERKVHVSFSLYSTSDDATRALYQASRQRSPISVMFQLGQESGQLFGIYIKSVVPEVPAFDDKDSRLQWSFGPSLAQGTGEDEVFLAFA